eukprot:TRINITY_DN28306_c0_g2_i1.p1 TRINITY_DN28306_c0_g2~~TRINITY_DN28306_c0_g2_i1.p1  ORF type:complete len:364 (+),score=131.78 TRINITY_DN28306_c0_g2_i1:50-1093(+)
MAAECLASSPHVQLASYLSSGSSWAIAITGRHWQPLPGWEVKACMAFGPQQPILLDELRELWAGATEAAFPSDRHFWEAKAGPSEAAAGPEAEELLSAMVRLRASVPQSLRGEAAAKEEKEAKEAPEKAKDGGEDGTHDDDVQMPDAVKGEAAEGEETKAEDGETMTDILSAKIAEKTSERETKPTELADSSEKLEELEQFPGATTVRCSKGKAAYQAADADLVKAISSLENAIASMGSSQPGIAKDAKDAIHALRQMTQVMTAQHVVAEEASSSWGSGKAAKKLPLAGAKKAGKGKGLGKALAMKRKSQQAGGSGSGQAWRRNDFQGTSRWARMRLAQRQRLAEAA